MNNLDPLALSQPWRAAVLLLTFVGASAAFRTIHSAIAYLGLVYGRPTVTKLIHSPKSYALVTGATDGLGKATALELHKRGFNLIIHGRNVEKLHALQNKLQQESTRDVRIWVQDASAQDVDFVSAVEQWKDLELTLVVHNVGIAIAKSHGRVYPSIASPAWANYSCNALHSIDEMSEEDVTRDIRVNALFPFYLTRALLPKLRGAHGPTQFVFIGSASAEVPAACLAPYGASKAFLKHLSVTLNIDERIWQPSGVQTNVSMLYVVAASICTAARPLPPTLFGPSAATFAKAMVDRFGCGQEVVTPWVPHALQLAMLRMMPKSILQAALREGMKQEIELGKRRE